jgi:hypothetical protein
MRHHVDVLGLLHLVWGAFGILAGVSLAILATGTHAALVMDAVHAAAGGIGAAERAAVWLLAVASVLMIASGVAWMMIGRGLRRLESRARLGALLLGIPNLLLLPFGTALAVYTFWVLLNNDARGLFGRPHRAADGATA